MTAACAGIATATFDPWFSSDPDEQEWAKARCARCPIGDACLAGARERGETAGIWFGVDVGAVELAEPVAWIRPVIYAPTHGSRAAYLRCTDGEDGGKCAACRHANAAYQAGYRDHGPAVTRPAVMDVFEQLTIGAMA